MHNIYTTKENLVIEIPLTEDRYNPYDDRPQGKMTSILGVIAGDEKGFAHYIDMSYCSKVDQVTTIFYHFWEGDKEDFEDLCVKLKINCYKYPVCFKCHRPIFGSSTFDRKGNEICYSHKL